MQLLKPAFTIIRDKNSKCFLLLIRGTHSIKDTLTAVTGAVVPFHHSVLHDGGISNLVLGYAHCGMVAAARWIAKLSTPCLLKALGEYPDFKIKVINAYLLDNHLVNPNVSLALGQRRCPGANQMVYWCLHPMVAFKSISFWKFIYSINELYFNVAVSIHINRFRSSENILH